MFRYLLTTCAFFFGFGLQLNAEESDTLLARLQKVTNNNQKVVALNKASEVCWQTGHYEKGILYAHKGLVIARKNKLKKLEGKLLNNLGIIYDYKGDYPKSLDCYFKALRIQEKINDLEGQAYSMSNIGLIYTNQNNNDEALHYHTKSLNIRQKLKNESGVAASLNNLGICYLNKKDFDKALDYFSRSKAIDVATKDSVGLMDDLNNIGLCLLEKKKYDEAIQTFQESLELRNKFKDQFGASKAINNIATCYMKLGKYKEADLEFKKGLEIAKKIGGNESIWYAYENLSVVAEELGKNKEALEYLRLSLEYKDSWRNANSIREEAETELSYQFEKKTELEKVRQLKKDLKKELDDKARATQNNIIFWSLGIIAVIIALFAIILFSRWKIATKQKQIIEEQRAVVEEKNDEILDSINYAKRIQSAVLPTEEMFRSIFPNFGMMYQPKDIVAGDFYWMHQVNDLVYFAVADCTGHGVPGAFMSLLCNNALNRAILDSGLGQPGEILNETRKIIVAEFAKSSMHLNDGMDISLCSWNTKTRQLTWAGANNPLWILKNNDILEIKGDKQPVGNHHISNNFKSHLVELEPGNRIYLFSDGIPDQFGGPQGKKFKSKQLRELLLESAHLSVQQQVDMVNSSFNNWKGSLEQIDDICFISIEF